MKNGCYFLVLLAVAFSSAAHAQTNLAVNGSFDSDLAPWWGVKSAGSGTVGAPEMLSRETADTWNGSPGALRLAVNVPSGVTYYSHNSGVVGSLSATIPSGSTVRLQFSAKSLSGATWVGISRFGGGGGPENIPITTSWQRYDGYFYMNQASSALVWNIVQRDHEQTQGLVNGVALIDDVIITIVEKGYSNLAANAHAEFHWGPWTAQKNKGVTLTPDAEMLTRAASGTGNGSLGAFKLKIAKQGDYDFQSHLSGAVCPFVANEVIKPGSVLRVRFMAKSVSGATWLSVTRVWGGSQDNVKLTSAWQNYEIYLPVVYDTGGLLFNLVPEDIDNIQTIANGEALLDDVDIRVVLPPAGASARFRADKCVPDSSGVLWCEDLSGNGHTASAPSASASPLVETNRIGGRPAIIFEAGEQLLFGDPSVVVGPSMTIAAVGQYTGEASSLLSLNVEDAGGLSVAALSSGPSNGGVSFSLNPPDAAASELLLSGFACMDATSRRLISGEPFSTTAMTTPTGVALHVNSASRTRSSSTAWVVPVEGMLGGSLGQTSLADALIYDHALNAVELATLKRYVEQQYQIAQSNCPALQCGGSNGCDVCGDGVVSGLEVCDPVGNPACKTDCSGAVTNASTELSCVDAVDNDGDSLVDCADVADCNLDSACRSDEGQSCTSDFDCEKNLLCAEGGLSTCRQPQCLSGIREANEGGRDCGGPCPACDGSNCRTSCVPGRVVAAPALETLTFASGNVQRASVASYTRANGSTGFSRANELRWVDVGGVRLALLEGASTNLLRWSEAFNHSPEWTVPASSPMSVTADVLAAPDGANGAERLLSLGIPGRSPVQTTQVPAGISSFSVHLRSLASDRAAPRRARFFGFTPENVVLGTGDWKLSNQWERFAFSVEAATPVQVEVGLSQVSAWPLNYVEELAGIDLGVWGAQLETLPFATSYIPTAAGQATRVEDSLTFSVVPAWMRTGQWQIDVAPQFTPEQMRADWRYTLVSFGPNQDLALVREAGATAARLVARFGATSASTAELTWFRTSILTITVDTGGDTLHVAGADEGDGIYPASGLAFTGVALRVGGALGGHDEAFAAIGEPRKVAASTATCTADAACACGNGIKEAGEECDSALDAHCDGSCHLQGYVIDCDGEECPTGQGCAEDVGDSYGLDPLADVCQPVICPIGPSSGGGTVNSPCGIEKCVPQCSGKTCGGDLSDGCGGRCAGVCGPKQAGPAQDSDCPSGHVIARGKGVHFGLPEGSSVCWPIACADPDPRRIECGTVASPCGTCAPPSNECNGRICGNDIHGNECGSCAQNQYCSQDGRDCFVALPDVKELHPELPVLPVEPSADAVGAIAGEFSVSDNGTASYSMPIEVPPGIAGVQPDLSLTYNSNGGVHGYAGTGWSVSGLSVVTLCNLTFAQNGVAKGARLDGGDPYCLDGQQLTLVNDLPNGAGSEYGTEFDTFRRIYAFGHVFNADGAYVGPQSFVVNRNDGTRLIYGSSRPAQAWVRRTVGEVDVTTNTAWYLEAVVDRDDNFYLVSYENFPHEPFDAATSPIKAYSGEIRPSEISYGYRGSHKVKFKYRKDPFNADWYPRGFTAGVGAHASAPIVDIVTSVNDKPVRTYRLIMTRGYSSWRLDEVQLHTATESGVSTKVTTTKFTYEDKAKDWYLVARTKDKSGDIQLDDPKGGRHYTRPENLSEYFAVVYDVDGDGREDLLHSGDVGLTAWTDLFSAPDLEHYYRNYVADISRGEIASGSGFKHTSWSPACGQTQVVDVDNGRTDDLLHSECAGGAFVLQAFGTELNLGAAKHMWAVDVEGDSTVDIVSCTDDDDWSYVTHAKLEECAHDKCHPPRTPLPSIHMDCSGETFDADGDGSPNLVMFDGENDKKLIGYVLHGDEAVYWGPVPFDWNTKKKTLLDANGDGLVDVVVADEKKKELRLYLNTAAGFTPFSSHPGIPTRFEYAFVADYNGDGRAELMVPDDTDANQVGRWMRHEPLAEGAETGYWSVTRSTLPYTPVYKMLTERRFQENSHHSWGWQKPTPIDWDGDGVKEIVVRAGDPVKPVYEIWKAASRKQGLLKTITDGLGKLVHVEYGDKAGMSQYTPVAQEECLANQRCFVRVPYPVVVEHTTIGDAGPYADPSAPAPTTIERRFTHRYEDGRAHTEGRGWLGFSRHVVRDMSGTDIRSETVVDYNLTTYASEVKAFIGAGHPVDVTTTSSFNDTLVPSNPSIPHRTHTSRNWILRYSGASLPYITLDYQLKEWSVADDLIGSQQNYDIKYDDFGNETERSSAWSDGRGTLSVTEYETGAAFLAEWLVSLPKTTTIISTDDVDDSDSSVIYNTTSNTYFPTGRLKTQTRGSLAATRETTTTYTWDATSRTETSTIEGRAAVTQSFVTVFDVYGYPRLVTNGEHTAKGFAGVETIYDPRTGQIAFSRSADGGWKNFTRDALGRERVVLDNLGTRVDTAYLTGSVGATLVRQSGIGVPTMEQEFNAFGNPVIVRETSFKEGGVAKTVVNEYGYNLIGERTVTGIPHFSDVPSPGAHVEQFDPLGRVVVEFYPWQTETGTLETAMMFHEYVNRPASGGNDSFPWASAPNAAWLHRVRGPLTSQGGLGTTVESATDLRGQPVASRDASQRLVTFRYNAIDSVKEVKVAGRVVTNHFDSFGRVTRTDDPATAPIDFSYDGLDLLRTETRGGIETAFTYDALGRQTAARNSEALYGWVWDGDLQRPWMVGRLESEFVASASLGNSQSTYHYDGPGGTLSKIVQNIDNEDLVAESFVTTFGHEASGRLKTVTYPALGATSVTAEFDHNEWGTVVALTNQGTAKEYWRINEFSQFGAPKNVSYGNATALTRTYEATTGRLASSIVKSLDGTTTHREEYLTYDSRGLVTTKREQLSGPPRTYAHDENGRLHTVAYKASADTYGYETSGNLKTMPLVGTLWYDDPRSATAATGTSDGRSYKYDDLGNQTERSETAKPEERQVIDYTTFDLPKQLRVGAEGLPATEVVDFRYDANHKRVAKQSSKGSRTTYVGDHFRRYKRASGPLEYVARIPGPSGIALELVQDGSGVVERYALEDYLGSADNILEGSTNRERRSYTPFGNASSASATKLNFTGHEDDLEFGLINMKGRMYDPALGRFLTPDPVVQNPLSVESWNRHSYVMNNPMNGTDPTGFEKSWCDTSPSGQVQCIPQLVEGRGSDYDTGAVEAVATEDGAGAIGAVATGDGTETGRGVDVYGGGGTSGGVRRGQGARMGTARPAVKDDFGSLLQQTTQVVQSAQLGALSNIAALAGVLGSGHVQVKFAPSNSAPQRDWLLMVGNAVDRWGINDFSAGFGDIVSFGATTAITNALGNGGVVDANSAAYKTGIVFGFANSLLSLPGAIGKAGGLFVSGGRTLARKASGGWLVRAFAMRGSQVRPSLAVLEWQKVLRIEAHPIMRVFSSQLMQLHVHLDSVAWLAKTHLLPIETINAMRAGMALAE